MPSLSHCWGGRWRTTSSGEIIHKTGPRRLPWRTPGRSFILQDPQTDFWPSGNFAGRQADHHLSHLAGAERLNLCATLYQSPSYIQNHYCGLLSPLRPSLFLSSLLLSTMFFSSPFVLFLFFLFPFLLLSTLLFCSPSLLYSVLLFSLRSFLSLLLLFTTLFFYSLLCDWSFSSMFFLNAYSNYFSHISLWLSMFFF